jgi:hypothetical protein
MSIKTLFLEIPIPMSYWTGDSHVNSLKKWKHDLESERAPVEIIHTCTHEKGIAPICGINNPKDLFLFGEISRNSFL